MLVRYKSLVNRLINNISKMNDAHMDYMFKKHIIEYCSMHDTFKGVREELYNGEEIIVCLTTYSKRIHTVYRTIETLFLQTYKPNRIVLYLAKDECPDIQHLPGTILRQLQRGLEVRYVKDIKSYKKLIPALKEFPDSTIITVDDDCLYSSDLLEHLIKTHIAHPLNVCGMECQYIKKKSERTLGPYNSFGFGDVAKDEMTSPNLIPEGFGGILYPPHSLASEISDEDLFMKLAPRADDIWFKCMGLKNGTKVTQVKRDFSIFQYCMVDDDVQDIALFNTNKNENQNDVQLKNVVDYFDLYSKLD